MRVFFFFTFSLLVFSNCQQNSTLPAPLPPFCGAGSFDVNGVTQNTSQYISVGDTCTEAIVQVQNGSYTLFEVYLHNDDLTNYSILIMFSDTGGFVIGQNYVASSSLSPYLVFAYNDLSSGNMIAYNNYDSSMNFSGNIVITNLDTVNNLISGSYQFDGYHSTFPSVSIANGVFTDVRVRFSYP